MSGTDEIKLTRKQERFVKGIVMFPELEQACEYAGVTTRTGYNWRQLPHVQLAIQDFQATVYEHVAARLSYGCLRAVEVLIEAMESDKPHIRVSAADKLLRHSIPIKDASYLEKTLEKFLNALETQSNHQTIRSTNGAKSEKSTLNGF